MTALLAEGFGLGLSTGLYCLGACAPLLVPYLLAEGAGWRAHLWALAQFLAGRLIAYVLFAAAVGALSARLDPVPPKVVGAALLASGLLLLVYGAVRNAPAIPACVALGRGLGRARVPFWLGFLVGLNVCPPFVAGLARLVALGEAFSGVLYFVAFFAGTTLYMAPLLPLAPLGRLERLRTVASLASLLSGLWFAVLGVSTLTSG